MTFQPCRPAAIKLLPYEGASEWDRPPFLATGPTENGFAVSCPRYNHPYSAAAVSSVDEVSSETVSSEAVVSAEVSSEAASVSSVS